MKKIFFETLKHKLGHYLLVILCGILMVSTIYVSYAFSDSIERIINGQNSGIVEEMYTFINFQETYILLFILMVLVIISYIQKKSYDYVLLDTMGLKKKHRYMFIGFEYAGIIFSSVKIKIQKIYTGLNWQDLEEQRLLLYFRIIILWIVCL